MTVDISKILHIVVHRDILGRKMKVAKRSLRQKNPVSLIPHWRKGSYGGVCHVYLVSAAYSLLMRALHQDRPQEWARTMLTTIGEACQAVKGELLGQLVDWIVAKLADDHWSVPQIKAVLAQT